MRRGGTRRHRPTGRTVPTEPTLDADSPATGRIAPAIAGGTHVGVVRRVNQDAFGLFEDAKREETLLVVADGLGGHRGGEVASRLAVDLLGRNFSLGDGDPPTRLVQAIESANADILRHANRERTLRGMGTTVVCLLLGPNGRAHVAHVGDSRLYRLRDGSIEPITEDHSLVATLVRQGVISSEEARTDPRRNQILRALGVRNDVEVDVAPLEPRPGDTYLLCSDGLHGLVDDDAIHALVHSANDLDAAVADLIDAAKRAGGTDNVTCVLARLPGSARPPAGHPDASAGAGAVRGLLDRPESE
ncbi:MAG: Stp1/IreP family PP2C-type Ser/Thr phosphatase [Spirochaetaceae bacterium]|nr:Stp1/IreP family PP2C-type Ser/Thr phosphatase [Myxococcales bacterium]MCB9723341.1 Stp1/IreP family PP2C-type Ser/Thr phosphatase [Spirochaetaceae bacterium]